MPAPYDERRDLNLVAAYLAARGLSAERFSPADIQLRPLPYAPLAIAASPRHAPGTMRLSGANGKNLAAIWRPLTNATSPARLWPDSKRSGRRKAARLRQWSAIPPPERKEPQPCTTSPDSFIRWPLPSASHSGATTATSTRTIRPRARSDVRSLASKSRPAFAFLGCDELGNPTLLENRPGPPEPLARYSGMESAFPERLAPTQRHHQTGHNPSVRSRFPAH